MKRPVTTCALELLLGLSLASPLATQAQGFAPAKGDAALRYRQSTMFMMSQHFGLLGLMVKGEKPYDKESFLHNAELVQMFSQMPWDSFWVPGSDQGKNRMKPEIFTEKDQFLGKAKRLQEETAKLVDVAKTGDQAAIKTQFGATGQACKSCHDSYRKE
jgi:cytochrome c556